MTEGEIVVLTILEGLGYHAFRGPTGMQLHTKLNTRTLAPHPLSHKKWQRSSIHEY